ncbi:response regulator [Arsenicibacter rosenii]|uniref:Response regulatory domain-containing protein n=1 Tax=Arsenicibacter rosenii TaxID=1750698 RepID=A0A1S2VGZ9_9BACT|nr:response regulator [Arsenicibacter rosenii]OIN58041.1 hypothetical protein BLX24_16040 [Arsenicibacter rosenii]
MSLRLSVLLYDDDADMRELVPRVLRKQYDVITQSRLQDVVAEVRHLKPDLILMDYYMHTSDSSAVIRKLKSDPATVHIPIILFSSHKHGDRLANELPVDGFLPKPFSLNTIRTCVAEVLDRMAVPVNQPR